MTFNIRNMRSEDVEVVARMDALDYDKNPEKGCSEAREHTIDHLKIVPEHCYVVEKDNKQVVAAMVLHPRKDVLEIEGFHVEKIERNKQALMLLKAKLLQYLENVQTEVLCCPYADRRLMET